MILHAKIQDTYKKKAFDSACDFLRTQGKKGDSITSAMQKSIDLFLRKDKEFYYEGCLANLSGAHLKSANLIHAHLKSANLSGARIQGADLIHANLQGADLYKAQFQGADLRNANLQGADLRNANLQGAVLRNANLQKVYLSEAQLQGAYLSKVQLQSADLSNAQLQGADLRNANLQGAVLSEVQLQGADLRNANLQRADLYNAQLQGTIFNKIKDLKDVNMVRNTDFHGTQLYKDASSQDLEKMRCVGFPSPRFYKDLLPIERFPPYGWIYLFAGKETNPKIADWIRGREDLESCKTGTYSYEEAMKWIIHFTELREEYQRVIDLKELKVAYNALNNDKAGDLAYKATMEKLLGIEMKDL